MNDKKLSLSQVSRGLPLDSFEIFCPFPLKVHPIGAADLDAYMLDWADGFGLLEEGPYRRGWNIGLFVAGGEPFLTEEAIKAHSCFFQLYMCWDEHLDELSADLGELAIHVGEGLHAFMEPHPSPIADGKWTAALRDAYRRVDQSVGSHDIREFYTANTRVLVGWMSKYAMSQKGKPPAFGEYLRMRISKSGMDTLTTFTAPGAGYDLPAGHYYAPELRALTCSVLWACIIINDIFSLAKELNTPQKENIILVLANEHEIGMEAALERAIVLYEQTVCLVVRLQAQLQHSPHPAVARYAREIPHWISSTLHFSKTSIRYFESPTFDLPVTLPAVNLVGTPTRWDPEDLTPPPYPDMAWWWGQLRAGACQRGGNRDTAERDSHANLNG